MDGPWAGAVGAWVPLADLLPTVRRELGIPEAEAKAALRNPLEMLRIITDVPDWDYGNAFDNQLVFRRGGWKSVSAEGLKHCWERGTLKGRAVLVRWGDVRGALAGLTAKYAMLARPEVAKRDGGAESTARVSVGGKAKKTRGRPGVADICVDLYRQRRSRGIPLANTKLEEARAILLDWPVAASSPRRPQDETAAAHIRQLWERRKPINAPDKL